MLITWKPTLEIGVAEIDDHHQHLVDLLNRVHDASRHQDSARVLELLDEVERYTHYHFTREEQLMEQIGYEFTAQHKEEHRRLYIDVQNHIEDLSRGAIVGSVVSMFLQRWLLRHIASADTLLGDAIRRRQQDRKRQH